MKEREVFGREDLKQPAPEAEAFKPAVLIHLLLVTVDILGLGSLPLDLHCKSKQASALEQNTRTSCNNKTTTTTKQK